MSKLADFSTIHAFCYKIVLRYAAKHNIKQPHVMGEEERVRLLCDIYTGLSGMQGVTEDTVKKISNYISSEGNAEN